MSMSNHWWVGIIVFLFFASLTVHVFLLRNKPKLSYAIAYSIALFLLVYKIGEYIYWQAIGEHMKIPVEFSALSYFVFAITVVSRTKKAEQFGTFVGVLTGLMYSVSFWVSPQSFLSDIETIFLFTMALLNHHMLYFAAMLILLNVRHYSYKNCWIQLVGIGAMVGYSWLIYCLTPYASLYGKPIIIQICDGSILSWLNLTTLSGGQVAIYVAICSIILCGLIVAFYAANNAMAKRRTKNDLPENYRPEKWLDIYKIK